MRGKQRDIVCHIVKLNIAKQHFTQGFSLPLDKQRTALNRLWQYSIFASPVGRSLHSDV